LDQLQLEPLAAGESIDAGAEEELFRRVGQQAAREALVRRWEQADPETGPECGRCRQRMKGLGKRSKQLRTLCGEVPIERRVYYCWGCQQTEAPLDRQLGLEHSGLTPGLARVVCRTALELAYQQSQHLLTDTLGFAPCSAREVERIAKQHGAWLEEGQAEGSRPEPKVRRTGSKPRAQYCLAIDGVMIAGLPDTDTHCVNWHEVKLATGFDPRQIQPPFYVAGREEAEGFGKRLWGQIGQHGLDERSFLEMLGDGAHWIWNLADGYFPEVPQLLDFYHAAEHLYATAEAVWPERATAHQWWQQRLEQLRSGQESNFFAALQWMAKRHRTEDPAVSPQRLLKYFEDNRERLNYRWALQHHLPIGSGQVESAARHIVQQRLKQSGMRWSDSGAQAILNLRTLHRNGEFEQYWENRALASASL
jgi:Uncharacterised protein family (UPF0236)